MSKRFGRNQRRRLTAELERTKQDMRDQASVSSMTIDVLRAKNDDQREIIELVADVLGRNFIGLPPRERKVSSIPWSDEHYYPMTRAGDWRHSITEHCVADALMRLQTIELEAERMRHSAKIHFRLRTPRGELAYQVAEGALIGVDRDKVERMLSRNSPTC